MACPYLRMARGFSFPRMGRRPMETLSKITSFPRKRESIVFRTHNEPPVPGSRVADCLSIPRLVFEHVSFGSLSQEMAFFAPFGVQLVPICVQNARNLRH
jgi:hypothetical protein